MSRFFCMSSSAPFPQGREHQVDGLATKTWGRLPNGRDELANSRLKRCITRGRRALRLGERNQLGCFFI
ncbi:hypothetical protein [Metallibacterium sp.]|uniref:hypothetical protein n=1 Tax=Metallibacterium sp. TaxID=2940281 RepID=UPI0026081EF1|nr:hypothetical protein [Metallibacterium sp.]